MNSSAETIVVGGGVIGAACAYYLAKSGRRVRLIEQGEFGAGCSHGNCGYICPSHILPLAAPGAIWPAIKALFQRNSAFKIRARFDPTLWSWLIRFAWRCNRHDMLETGRALQAMLNASRTLYGELMQAELADCEWEERGLLFVFQSRAGFDHYAETDELLRHEFGLGATGYDGEQLVKLEPALKPGLGGAWHYETDAHLRPDRLMVAWRRRLEELGVVIQTHCVMQGFERCGKLVTKVRTSQGTLEADAVVIATGAWTPLLAEQLGCAIPIQPGKGYSITMPRPQRCPQIPMIFEEHRVAITPFEAGYRIGSTMEFAGYDAELSAARLSLLRNGADLYLHEPFGDRVLEQWAGWRPMIYDGKPAVGAVPGAENLFVAAGHGMLGISLAPSTGKLMAELLNRQTPHLDPHPFRPSRFAAP